MSCVVDICFLNGAFSCYCEGYVSCNKFVVKETIERTNTREKKWADSDTSMPFSNSAAPSWLAPSERRRLSPSAFKN